VILPFKEIFMSEKLSGVLEVMFNPTGGPRHAAFMVDGRTLAFPDTMFASPARTICDENGAYKEMTEAGLNLYERVYALGGKGVVVTGESSQKSIPFGIDQVRVQLLFIVQDIEVDESLHPTLNPFLQRLLDRQKKQSA
jgi:hypothetical protein